jgi:hypothetical protein
MITPTTLKKKNQFQSMKQLCQILDKPKMRHVGTALNVLPTTPRD